jgi:low affinity Fe/Cu permease
MAVTEWFSHAARFVADQCGSAWACLAAVGIVILWAVTGPYFQWSDTWQLVINTGTTIITFIMVFLLQHTQTRDTLAIQIKLDELIRASAASNAARHIEDLSEAKLRELRHKDIES